MRNRKMTLMSPGYDSKSLHATLFSAQLLQQKCVLKTTAFLKNKTEENRRRKQKKTTKSFFFSHLLIGTPASCNAKQPPHTVAMLELPLLSVTVLSILIVNGKSSSFGIIGNSALSAKFPCPISRRFAPPTRPHSPTELGGKK
jgi:hypothetical protein|tara:strand:- start:142 stop:570 length:429 start_codon:yes stop_codon:yes gene_type:complete